MPDNEQQIYTLPNDGNGWATGDVITADKMNAIGNILHNTSAEVVNAVNENIDSNGPNNDILARKLDGLVKYFNSETTPSNADLQYNRMYVQKLPEGQEEIIVPKQSEYLQFKANFVSPFSKTQNYAAGAYVEYNDKVYKVLTAISANGSAADDAAAWNAIASGSIREINVMQELDNLINIYSNDSQLTQEQNRIWIQENSTEVQVPTYNQFENIKNVSNKVIELLNYPVSYSGTNVPMSAYFTTIINDMQLLAGIRYNFTFTLASNATQPYYCQLRQGETVLKSSTINTNNSTISWFYDITETGNNYNIVVASNAYSAHIGVSVTVVPQTNNSVLDNFIEIQNNVNNLKNISNNLIELLENPIAYSTNNIPMSKYTTIIIDKMQLMAGVRYDITCTLASNATQAYYYQLCKGETILQSNTIISGTSNGTFYYDITETGNDYSIRVASGAYAARVPVSATVVPRTNGSIFDRIIPSPHIVHSGESLLNGVVSAYAEGATKIIVEPGTYNVISDYTGKYGSSYFTSYTSNYNNLVNGYYDRGIWLNNIEIIFQPGAKVIANYTGNNANVIHDFSAFAIGDNAIIDGLVLESSNIRYGIHADFQRSAYGEITIKNCEFTHIRSDHNQAIGAGFGVHSFWKFNNIIFHSDGTKIVFRIHNNVAADAESTALIENCRIIGDGYFTFNSYGTNTTKSQIHVIGCSWNIPPIVGREANTSVDNIELITWNSGKNESIDYHSSHYITSSNIFDGEYEAGRTILNNGTMGSDNNYGYTTNFIQVDVGDKIIICSNHGIRMIRMIAAYDKNYKILPDKGLSTPLYSAWTVPDGVYYIKITAPINIISASDCAIYRSASPALHNKDTFTVIETVNRDAYRMKHFEPLRFMPDYMADALSYRPLGKLSKGYICMTTDDGTSGLATYTIPMAIQKGVPFTFAVMKDSEVFADNTMKATVLDAVNNHGCSLMQHGGIVWDTLSERDLNNFFDIEKAFFDQLGVEVKGAAPPQIRMNSLVKAVCGARFGVVRGAYCGLKPGPDGDVRNDSVSNFYDYYTSGERSNIFGLSGYNCAFTTIAYNHSAVDYAKANNKIMIVYYHEFDIGAEQKTVIEDLIDYAKAQGLEFITIGDIPALETWDEIIN